MDDTQQSRASDAGATRKRRSSILKIQRPPRTPFSELEFSVATPTDTAKSRRVSFSRRTGVAEFVTNEATTTWKNFYEEHNKSLESSGNDSGANASRQPIGHLGKRIFEQQFEEVEAVDFITSLDNLAGRNVNNTMNINFTEQLASLEATDSIKPVAPQNNFELSALTDHHSKIFSDDLGIAAMGEASGRIDINFSAVQSIDIKDDLDEIQRDIERQSSIVGPPPFRDARDFSEYIEVELNSTHAAIRTEESDMSITETIPSPKVNISKILSPPDKKSNLNWVDDKENKRLDDLDIKAKTLIFDGNDMSITTAIPSKVSQESEKRRTIVFEDAFADLSMTKPLPVKMMLDDKENRRVDSDIKSKSYIVNADMSMTAVLPGRITVEPEKQKTMIFDDDLGDLSMTRPLTANLIHDKDDIRVTSSVVDIKADMSMTEVLPSKIKQESEKRRTMIFDDDLGDLSMTKPIPAKLLSVHSEFIDKSVSNDMSSLNAKENTAGKRRTILFDNDLGDLSMTKPIPAQMLATHSEIINKSTLNENFNKSVSQPKTAEKRKTILFDDDLGDLSMTKPIPTNMLSTQSEIMNRTNLNDIFNRSVAQKETSDKRKTIVFDDDGDLSMTKPVPVKMLSENYKITNKSSLIDNLNKSNLPKEIAEKRKTILFEDDLGDLSMTKPVPAKMLSTHSEIINKSNPHDNFDRSNLQPKVNADKHKSIVLEDDLGNLSITKSVPTNILSINNDMNKTNLNDTYDKSISKQTDNADKRKTILFEDDLCDLSITKPIPAKLLSAHSEIIDKSNVNKSFNKPRAQEDFILKNNDNVMEYDNEKLAGTSNIADVEPPKENMAEKRKTILFDDGFGDLSMTKPIPAQLLSVHSEIIEKTIIKTRSFISEEKHVKSMTVVYDNNDRAMSISPTLELPAETEKRNTMLFDDNVGDMSMTKPIPAELLSVHSEIAKPTPEMSNKNHSIRATEKRNTIMFENDTNDISLTKPIPSNIMDIQKVEFNKTKENNSKENELASMDFSKFKAQDVVVYQFATNEASVAQNTADESNSLAMQEKIEEDCKVESIDDQNEISISRNNIEQGDAITVESSNTEKKEKESIEEEADKDEDHIKMEINTDDECNTRQVEQEEEKDISRNVSKDSVVLNMSVVAKKSILCDLLDMSNASLTSRTENKDVSVKINSEKHCDTVSKTDTPESVASDMFYITKDTDSESQSNEVKDRKNKSITFVDVETNEKLLSDESIPELIDNVQSALSELKDSDSCSIKNFNQMVNMDTADVGVGVTLDRSSENLEVPRYPKSFSEVDNTKELLDMLSDLTEERQSMSHADPTEAISSRLHDTLENKETNEPRRVSIAPNRQSIVLNREDLLNNISMAQAALQRSIDMEDSDVEEPTPAVAISPPKKIVRVSNEVVKTLHFEDESTASEASVKADLKSPLKKTAFGETSYMKETHKSNVIPSYLKDVSDGIKSLMHDLVKPMADEQPFETCALGKVVRDSPSTCSTQIQANLITSSQIDLPIELTSNPASIHDTDKDTANATKSPMKSVSFTESEVHIRSDLVSRNLKEASFRPKRQPVAPLLPGRVLVFDHENPLNNVLLTPAEFTDVHKYSPPRDSNETLSGSEKSNTTQCSIRGKEEFEVENVSIKFDYTTCHTRCPSGDSGADRLSKIQSKCSDISKPASIDRSISVRVTEVKDMEVNTAIIMKKNKELLDASSSLTLVDDAIAQPTLDVDVESATADSNSKSEANLRSPLKIIYTVRGDVRIGQRLESDFTSTDEGETKPKKRNYSPTSSEKQSSPSSQNVTPKPVSKMQRLSDTPNSRNYSLKRISGNKSLAAEKDASSESKMDIDLSPSKESPRKRSPKKKNSPKKGVSITVQQLLTEFNVQTEIDQKKLDKEILDALSKTDSSAAPESVSECGGGSLEMVSSFTSSKNQCKVGQSTTTTGTESTDTEEWLEKSNLLECDSSVNVVAKIDMLSFMGSHECEWASSGTDMWSFRLLHGRLRLSVRLAHRHHNATRTRVRGDTPVTAVTVHQSHHGNDKRNSVAKFCVSFAADSVRAAVGPCSRAGDVPALLRRAAASARRALRWGRHMHDARMHLAYTLTEDGQLVLKVANIPLRCVWEVSMRLELSAPAAASPWPRATDVRVTRVLDNVLVLSDVLRGLLDSVPDGWQHAPTTVWRIFKYLKNMTADDDGLAL